MHTKQLVFLMQWMETETVRLSHLCDRASDMGKRKEYPFSLKHSLDYIDRLQHFLSSCLSTILCCSLDPGLLFLTFISRLGKM